MRSSFSPNSCRETAVEEIWVIVHVPCSILFEHNSSTSWTVVQLLECLHPRDLEQCIMVQIKESLPWTRAGKWTNLRSLPDPYSPYTRYQRDCENASDRWKTELSIKRLLPELRSDFHLIDYERIKQACSHHRSILQGESFQRLDWDDSNQALE